MDLLCNITERQARALAGFFQTLLAMNDAHDLVKSTGPTGQRGGNLNDAVKEHDAAIREAAAIFRKEEN